MCGKHPARRDAGGPATGAGGQTYGGAGGSGAIGQPFPGSHEADARPTGGVFVDGTEMGGGIDEGKAQIALFKTKVQPVYAMVQEAIGVDNMKLMLSEVEKAEKAAFGAKGGGKKAAPKKNK